LQEKPAMKKPVFLFAGILLIINLDAQQTFNVNQGVGDTFDPVQLTVTVGDIVQFNLAPPHNVTQVSMDTWNANGTTPLPGGFLFASGSGAYTTTTVGTIYYVCTVHVSFGMKGTIIVNAVTGINDIHKLNGGVVYPNPSTDFITYSCKGNYNIQEVRIMDITGKTVKILQNPETRAYQVKIDISSLDKGMYFILVKSAGGFESGKFLKA
jgi:plastocyanin